MDEDDVKLVVLCNVAMEDGASGDEDRDAGGRYFASRLRAGRGDLVKR
jgi:hypothetical protein